MALEQVMVLKIAQNDPRTSLTTASDVMCTDRDARLAEQIVGRTADLVLKASGLAERYERAEPSEARAARVLALRTTALQGCSLIFSVTEPDWTPRRWETCP